MRTSAGPGVDEHTLLSAAKAGDRDAFDKLMERYRGELQAHCYRMLASLHHERVYLPSVLDVLTVRGTRIAAVTAFVDGALFPQFGLPETLPA